MILLLFIAVCEERGPTWSPYRKSQRWRMNVTEVKQKKRKIRSFKVQ